MSKYVCPSGHKHGLTGTCYVAHKCRCGDCREGRAAYGRRLRKRHAYGQFDDVLTDIEPVREHVYMLQEYGIGWKRIAEVAGVGNTAVSQIIYGRKGATGDPRKGETLKRISRVTAEKILAVEPRIENLRPGASISAVGFRRRVQALVWKGWSMSKIGVLIGVQASNMAVMMAREQVTVAKHLQMVDVFDRLWDQEPPNSEWRDKIAFARSQRLARERGWVSALAWDDFDDPLEVPDGVAVPGRARVDRELIEWSWREGLPDPVIAERAGCSEQTVRRVRLELRLETRWAA